MPDHLMPHELAELARIETDLAKLDEKAAPLKARRKALLGLERQRAFRARHRAED